MNGIDRKFGKWLHAEGFRHEMTFGEDRKFTVIIAGAEDAGIIGPENNGIVIVDENNRLVVLDMHLKASSGAYGPTSVQIREFERIKEMDWSAFSAFCVINPRYRGNVPDFRKPEPDSYLVEPDRLIYPAADKLEGYAQEFPLENRNEIIAFLLAHPVHKQDGPYSNTCLAWNIKVRGFEDNGRVQDYEPNPDFDSKWKEYLKGNNDIFSEVASDQISMFLEGDYDTGTGLPDRETKFSTTGRSGGWLILTGFDDQKDWSWGSMNEMEEGLKELDDGQLQALYRVVRSVDMETDPPSIKAAMECGYAERRYSLEEDWSDDVKAVPQGITR